MLEGVPRTPGEAALEVEPLDQRLAHRGLGKQADAALAQLEGAARDVRIVADEVERAAQRRGLREAEHVDPKLTLHRVDGCARSRPSRAAAQRLPGRLVSNRWAARARGSVSSPAAP